MWKFMLALFLPAIFAGWLIAEPGRYRGAEGFGGGLFFLAVGLVSFYIANRNRSERPGLWGAMVMAATFGLAFLGAS